MGLWGDKLSENDMRIVAMHRWAGNSIVKNSLAWLWMTMFWWRY